MTPPLIAQHMNFYTDEQLGHMTRAAGFIDVSIARLDHGHIAATHRHPLII
jgi:hypothetical protein